MLEPVEASVAAFNVLAYTVVGGRTQWGETREKIIGVAFCPRLLNAMIIGVGEFQLRILAGGSRIQNTASASVMQIALDGLRSARQV